ncbi:MAG: FG-GAP repeat protein, partial [Ignavibacteria bacterium]|nr:FG-GAP repeat protein [Ignavibacteria bacterium]
MKTFFAVLFFPLFLGILSGFYSEDSENAFNIFNYSSLPGSLHKLQEVQKNQTVDAGNLQNSDWYSSAISNIQRIEYNIKYDEKLGAFQSPNRANNMRFIYHKDGFTAKLRQNKIALFNETDKLIDEKDKKYRYLDEWEIKLRITNYELQIKNNEFMVNGNKAYIENENIRIDYTNSEEGMRQDFIIKNKPEKKGKLQLNLSADTRLKMILSSDALIFKDKKNDLKLKYSSLKCWDANGRELRAYFVDNAMLRVMNYEQRDKSNGGMSKKNETCNSSLVTCNYFSIVVNDEDAVYPVTIDPLSSTPVWTAEPNQDGAYFGASVATAGDVNGDGKSDVIVGAFLYDNGQSNEGGVFVFHGSVNGLSLSPAWTAEGNQESANFGLSVATAGDVNGDGFSDVIISAPYFDHGQTDEGIVYVYLGSTGGLESTPFWTYETNRPDDYVGYCVACAGDYDADGLSDLIIGIPYTENGQTDEGRVYTFKGNATSISSIPDWTFENNSANSLLGRGVATAGDINADGRSDIIVSAYEFDTVNANTGRVYVFLSNGTSFPLTPNTTLTGTQLNEYYGNSISTAGDVNADGYSDIIVGSPGFDNGQTDEGKCFAYLGSASGLVTTPNWTKESNEAGGLFGVSVSTAGDINGDGYADIILGGNKLDDGVQTDEGRVFLYLGKNSGVHSGSTIIYESNQPGSEFGYSVALAGDVNGDGFSDIVVGAYRYSNGQSYEGRAFLYLGSAHPMSTTQNVLLEKNQASSLFGCSVSTAGDVNGDGYADVIIGASDFDNGQTDEGAAFVYHGSASGLSVISNWTAESNQAAANFGNAVSTAGDVNGDGYSDVIVGAYHFSNQQSNEGRVFIYHGSASGLSASPNLTIESNQTDAYFGESVSTAGDVNGDGYSDVLVGSPNFDNGQTNEGGAFLYSGSSSGLSGTASWTTESNQVLANYGASVSSAGDVNGDGYSDVIIGAPLYDQSFTDAGRAYLYRGSSSGLSTTASWTGTSGQLNSYYGHSVSCAGDVNGDGLSDIIVGANSFSNGQSNEGKAYLYYGADPILTIPDWTAEGNQQSANYGVSVSSAGDVNGDGYSDVIVGATDYDNGNVNEGRAYIYNGSSNG